MKNNNLDIFIGAYKKFEPPITNKAYKVIIGNHNVDFDGFPLNVIKCGNESDVLDDRFYSEQYMLRNLVEDNYPFKEYVGFCHYRKYFSFLDDIPNLDEIFSEYECIVSKPIALRNSIKKQYGKCHNIEDLEIVEKIIKDKFPQYEKACEVFLNNQTMIPYEMFIMKREDFIDYVNFVNNVLDEYVNIVGTDIVGRIDGNKDKYLKSFPPNDTVEYQYRIGGYLAERLTNVFLMHRFKKMKVYPVKITEAKYDNEKKKIKPRFVRVGSNGILVDTNDGIIRLYRGSEMVYKGTFDTLVDNIKGNKKRETENE